MKIFSFLFVAAISFFSFNSFTTDHTDPVKVEGPSCTATCAIMDCNADCSSSGGGSSHCSCTFGIGYCECDGESVAAPDPMNETHLNNINNYKNILSGLESEGAAAASTAISNLVNLAQDGVKDHEIRIYVELVKQHTAAVESMPDNELALVQHFYE